MDAAQDYNKKLFWLLGISFAARWLVAGITELGNDEVYYITYALFPAASHFDHPPAVGWLIQLFTLNLNLTHEAFIRLGPVVIGTLNTWLIYRIGKLLYSSLAGWYGALLYTASIYAMVICGIFIMPDAPQSVFWLITLYLILTALKRSELNYFLPAGIAIGLALLSKYTSAFLLTGFWLYVVFFNRKLFLRWQPYAMTVAALLVFSPVVFWNIQNDFISFTFHGGRVETGTLRLDYFLQQIAGEALYNNPLIYLVILAAVILLVRGRINRPDRTDLLLPSVALPLIGTFLAVSLTRATLPHWTGPAYLTLIPLAGYYIQTRTQRVFPRYLTVSLGLILLILLLGTFQIRTGRLMRSVCDSQTGNVQPKDPSVEMAGWKQLGETFGKWYNEAVQAQDVQTGIPIVSHRWFPAAHLDHYVARPLGLKVLAINTIDKIHKYAWINRDRGYPKTGEDALYITSAYENHPPTDLYQPYFDRILPVDTLRVYRGGEVMNCFYIWRLEGWNGSYNTLSPK